MTERKPILFFLDRIQDLDVLTPVMEAVPSRGERVSVWMTRTLARRWPRAVASLQRFHVHWKIVSRWNRLLSFTPDLEDYRALVTASESTARPHRAAHLLTRRANRLGLRTCTLQHGFENVGLTYFDREYPPGSVDFASQILFIWGKKERLHESVPKSVRDRCMETGRAKRPSSLHSHIQASPGHFTVSIFENLHWDRYPEIFRGDFIRNVARLVWAFPDVSFIVRPHPDERRFFRQLGNLQRCPNVRLADPCDAEWSDAESLLAVSDAVITTPSTIALDAASLSKPVAVVAPPGDEVAIYRPLYGIGRFEEWVSFVERARNPASRPELEALSKAFTEAVLIPGDATERILNVLTVL